MLLSELRVPVIAAPMAGGPSTPELVAAVTEAGGLGFLGGGYLTPDALARQITALRERTDRPFGVNLFMPGDRPSVDLADYRRRIAAEAAHYGVQPGDARWDDDAYPTKLDLVIDEGVPVVSFTFGCPIPADVARLHEAGCLVVITVTGPEEAGLAEEVGVDALCVQGMDAGGHRGTFLDLPDSPSGGDVYGLLSALRLIANEVDLPLIAAGGIVHGADVAAVLAAGAVAAQCGTAFMLCPEAGTPPTQRAALAAGGRKTAFTRAFSGRTARGQVNRFLTEHSPHAPAAYPQVHHLTRPVRGAAGQAGDPEAMSLWAGQTYSLITDAPAAEVVRRLAAEADEAITAVANRFRKA